MRYNSGCTNESQYHVIRTVAGFLCAEENLYIADGVWFVYCTGSFFERFNCTIFNGTVVLRGLKFTIKAKGQYMYRTVVTKCTV